MRNPPLEYLLACSEKSLQDFELNRLNHAANIRKQMQISQEEIRQADAEAALARWLMEYRGELLAGGVLTQHSFEFPTPRPALPSGAPQTQPGPAAAIPAKRKAMTA
jgi:hypothetical protein